MRAESDILREIAGLRELAPRLRPYSMFGENNHARLEVAITVLENRMDIAAVQAAFAPSARGRPDDDVNGIERLYDQAMNTSYWLTDKLGLESRPSEGWPLLAGSFQVADTCRRSH